MGTKKGCKKRFWSDDEKRSICLQTCVSGVSVAQVARRYALNANLVHSWLKDPRFMPALVEDGEDAADSPAFLPVEIEGAVSSCAGQNTLPRFEAPLAAQRVDITLSDGRRLLIEGTTTLTAVLGLVEGLMS